MALGPPVPQTCVFRTSYESDCKTHPSFDVGGNRVFSKNGSLTVCGGKVNFTDWQNQGHDIASTLGKWPADGVIVAQAKAILGF